MQIIAYLVSTIHYCRGLTALRLLVWAPALMEHTRQTALIRFVAPVTLAVLLAMGQQRPAPRVTTEDPTPG